jgi:hypothetical protein
MSTLRNSSTSHIAVPLEWWQGVLFGPPIRRITRWLAIQERDQKPAGKDSRRKRKPQRGPKVAKRQNDPPHSGHNQTKVGCVTRRPLSDGRPYPETLAAQQFNAKHCQLLDDRLQDALGGGLIFVKGQPLNGDACLELLTWLQLQLLPEVYDPDYIPVARKAPAGMWK